MHHNDGFEPEEDDFFLDGSGESKGKMIPEPSYKSNVTDKRKIKLEEILKTSYIPFLGGRPNRDKVIGKDDLCDLKIALAVTSNMDAFLQQV